MSLVCHLDWSKLTDTDGARICALLSAWQRDIKLPSYHEMCLRVSITNSDRFPRPCQILSLVSSIPVLAEKKIMNPSHLPDFLPLSGGNNCGAAITEDDRLMIWGNFTNAQQRMEVPRECLIYLGWDFENFSLSEQNLKPKRSDSVTNGTPAVQLPPSKPEQVTHRPLTDPSLPLPIYSIFKQLPRVLEYPGNRPRAIACGAEHILVLSSSGQLSAWGGNKHGQCGVGHSFRLANLQVCNWEGGRGLKLGSF